MSTSTPSSSDDEDADEMALQPELLVTQNINGCDGYDEEKNGAVKPVRPCLSANAELQGSKKNKTA